MNDTINVLKLVSMGNFQTGATVTQLSFIVSKTGDGEVNLYSKKTITAIKLARGTHTICPKGGETPRFCDIILCCDLYTIWYKWENYESISHHHPLSPTVWHDGSTEIPILIPESLTFVLRYPIQHLLAGGFISSSQYTSYLWSQFRCVNTLFVSLVWTKWPSEPSCYCSLYYFQLRYESKY